MKSLVNWLPSSQDVEHKGIGQDDLERKHPRDGNLSSGRRRKGYKATKVAFSFLRKTNLLSELIDFIFRKQ